MAIIKTNLTHGTTGNLPAVNGSAVTALNASNVASGTLNTSRYVGGKILQIVSATHTSATTSSSTKYVNTGLTINITPSATSSKIWVISNILGISSSAGTGSAVSLQLLQDTTKVAETINVGFGDTAQENQGVTLQTLDAPNSTSQITYKVQFKNRESATVGINTSSDHSKITAFEVAG